MVLLQITAVGEHRGVLDDGSDEMPFAGLRHQGGMNRRVVALRAAAVSRRGILRGNRVESVDSHVYVAPCYLLDVREILEAGGALYRRDEIGLAEEVKRDVSDHS